MIACTIRNTVRMAFMDNQWQQKKASGLLKKQDRNKELTAQERQLAMFQEQVEQIQKSRERAQIDAKLKAGEKLTADEIDYLRRTDPAALKEYEETEMEREAYKKALRNCRSKEAVEKLKMTKLGNLLAQAKKISSNANIPENAKKAMLEKILRITNVVMKEHLKFVRTPQYKNLPEKIEDEDKGRDSGPEGEAPEAQEQVSEEKTAEDYAPEEDSAGDFRPKKSGKKESAPPTGQGAAAAGETAGKNSGAAKTDIRAASPAEGCVIDISL